MLATKIASKMSALTAQMGQEGVNRMQQDAERFGQAAAVLDGLPPMAHKKALSAIVQKYGGDVNNPMMAGLLQLPDEELAKAVRGMSKGMALATRKFTQEQELKQQENQSQERINKANNDRAMEVAKTNAAAREKASKAALDKAMAKLSIEDRIGALEEIPEALRTPDEAQNLMKLKEFVYTKKAAGAPAVAPTVMGQDTPIQAAQKAARGGEAPTAQSSPNLEAQVKAANWDYEPDKYHYRINPETGIVERKVIKK
jgi:hypothetical protein